MVLPDALGEGVEGMESRVSPLHWPDHPFAKLVAVMIFGGAIAMLVALLWL